MINEEKILGKLITEELGVLDEVGNWTNKIANDFILNCPKETQEIAEHIYIKSSKWLKRIVSMSLKSCRRQLSRAIAKVRKDYDYTHGGNTSVTV